MAAKTSSGRGTRSVPPPVGQVDAKRFFGDILMVNNFPEPQGDSALQGPNNGAERHRNLPAHGNDGEQPWDPGLNDAEGQSVDRRLGGAW